MTAISRKVVGKTVHATIPKGRGLWSPGTRISLTTLVCHMSSPQLSRQNQKPHGKTKNVTAKPKNLMAKRKYLTAKPKTSRQKQNTSRQNQILHSKNKIALVLPWVFAFAVRYLVFAVKYLVLPWGFWFCRDSCGPPYMSDSSSRSYLLPSHPTHLHPSYSPSVPLFSKEKMKRSSTTPLQSLQRK